MSDTRASSVDQRLGAVIEASDIANKSRSGWQGLASYNALPLEKAKKSRCIGSRKIVEHIHNLGKELELFLGISGEIIHEKERQIASLWMGKTSIENQM